MFSLSSYTVAFSLSLSLSLNIWKPLLYTAAQWCAFWHEFSPLFCILLESWSNGAAAGQDECIGTFGRRVVNVTTRATNSLPPPFTLSQNSTTHKVKDLKSVSVASGGRIYTHTKLLSRLYTHCTQAHSTITLKKNLKNLQIERGEKQNCLTRSTLKS